MKQSKPRQWWIAELRDNDYCDEAWRSNFPHPSKRPIHVVEKSYADQLEKRIEKLRGVLKFYANEANYDFDGSLWNREKRNHDFGLLAVEALEQDTKAGEK